jgi:hypothetical protein
MIDDALILGVQKVANYKMKKDYPLVGENHFHKSDVRMILESLVMILEEYDIQQSAESHNRNSKSTRSKGVCKVSTK